MDWITNREAAAILGVHMSAVPKMIRRGDLTPRERRPQLARNEVEELRDRRAQPKPPKPTPDPKPRHVPKPPDQEHDWLNADEAAELLGLGRSGVIYRAQLDKLPNEKHDGRRWFRRDHLELVKRAASVKRRALRDQ